MTPQRHQSLFAPDIAPGKAGGIVLHQNGQRIVIEDCEVERFVEDLEALRRRQLFADCRQIAADCVALEFELDPGAA